MIESSLPGLSSALRRCLESIRPQGRAGGGEDSRGSVFASASRCRHGLRRAVLALLFAVALAPAFGQQGVDRAGEEKEDIFRVHLGGFVTAGLHPARTFVGLEGGRVVPSLYRAGGLDPTVGMECNFDCQPVGRLVAGMGCKLFYFNSRYEVGFDGADPLAVSSEGLSGCLDLFVGYRPMPRLTATLGVSLCGPMRIRRLYFLSDSYAIEPFLRVQYNLTDRFYLSLRGGFSVRLYQSRYATRFYVDDLYRAEEYRARTWVLGLGAGCTL